MTYLVVGGGGREHTIVRKLKESAGVDKIYCTPGNGGISKDAEVFDVAATDIDGVVALVDAIGGWLQVTGGESTEIYADHELRVLPSLF